MKILVLGNGFDLDHDLPTSYSAFLNFCNCVLSIDTDQYVTAKSKLSDFQVDYVSELEKNSVLKDDFVGLLKNNHLFHYFNAQQNKSGNNWIDFEREIKNIISEFRIAETLLKKSNTSTYVLEDDHKIFSLLHDLKLNCLRSNHLDTITLAAIHTDLCICLDRFTRVLELYICHFINQTKVMGTSPDIIDFDANRILTFNYSNTYERIYGGLRWNEEIDHIHGSAEKSIEDGSNVILGITTTGESQICGYVEFEKYYQRIVKKTKSHYKNWVQSKSAKNAKIEVAFFGHSLDATDEDVIKDIVLDERTLITVFYYDETAYKQIVANLIEIIGKEKLVSFIYGDNPKIKFVKQQAHQKDSNAGVEITRDIRKLYSLYKLSNQETAMLIEKIKEKMQTKDPLYFYSQSKVISLYEALRFHQIVSDEIDLFADICTLFDYEVSKTGRLKYHQDEEWCDYEPWGEEIPCDKMTSKLISRVNRDNQNRYDQERTRIPYYNILKMTNSIEIKEALLDAFSIEVPTPKYWKQLDQLIHTMQKNELLEEALRLIDESALTLEVRAKFKHFSSVYWEMVFYIDYNKQMQEAYAQNPFDEEG